MHSQNLSADRASQPINTQPAPKSYKEQARERRDSEIDAAIDAMIAEGCPNTQP